MSEHFIIASQPILINETDKFHSEFDSNRRGKQLSMKKLAVSNIFCINAGGLFQYIRQSVRVSPIY